MTIDEAIKHCEEVAEKQEITAKSNLMETDKTEVDGVLRLYDADEYASCMQCASEHRQLAEWLKELKAYRELYLLDNGIKNTLSEINGIHERIRQCNERYEKRMAELERPVEFYDINGPLKITREEDNNG